MNIKKHSNLLLLILDGWGHRECSQYNAIAMANTPNWDHLWEHYPHTCLLYTSPSPRDRTRSRMPSSA